MSNEPTLPPLQSPENSTIKSVYCLLLEARAREQQAKFIRMPTQVTILTSALVSLIAAIFPLLFNAIRVYCARHVVSFISFYRHFLNS